MHKADVFNTITQLLENQTQCVLATIAGVQPCMHLMAYAFNESLSELYLASYADTRKVKNMLAQPCVSLLWDNRTGNQQDHVQGLALNAIGQARLLAGSEQDTARELLLGRNTTLQTLLAADNTLIFSVAVSSYTLVRGYSEVYEYCPATA